MIENEQFKIIRGWNLASSGSALVWIPQTAMNSSGSVKILRLLRAMPVKHELRRSSLVELSGSSLKWSKEQSKAAKIAAKANKQ